MLQHCTHHIWASQGAQVTLQQMSDGGAKQVDPSARGVIPSSFGIDMANQHLAVADHRVNRGWEVRASCFIRDLGVY